MTSTLEVSEPLLRANLRAIHRALADAAPNLALLAVIKANAYGHSAPLCAPMLARAGVPWLGVTDAEEGVAVRAALGTSRPAVLLMSGPPADPAAAREAASLAVHHTLTPVVWTSAQLPPLAEAATSPHPVHLEIDTGMSRQGVPPGPALAAFLTALAAQPRLYLDGVFTHLASAEAADAQQTTQQGHLFAAAIHQIASAGLRPAWVHLGNASTIDNAAPAAAPTLATLHALAASVGARLLVRCGLALYGHTLPLQPVSPARLHPHLQPILTWSTPITSLLEVPAGAHIGYGAAFTAPHAMRLALLPVGYADGLRRALSSTDTQPGGWVMIHNQRAPILGRISMNLTTVDVTHFHPAPQPGDRAVLLGPGISAEDHARLAATIPYEILCGLRGHHRAT